MRLRLDRCSLLDQVRVGESLSGMTAKWTSRVALAGLLMVASVAALALPAGANWTGTTYDYGTCSSMNRGDSSPHSFYYSKLSSPVKNAADATRQRLSYTDLATKSHSTQYATTDVVIIDKYYVSYCDVDWFDGVSGATGHERCNALTSTGKCETADVRISMYFVDLLPTSYEHSLLCHEIGHSIGLTHTSDTTSCLKPSTYSSVTYSTHDIGHINANF